MSKRLKLLEAAKTVIEQQGIDHLTLEAVAAEAGVSKGGLLYHFRTKDDLIKALNEQSLQQFQACVKEEMEAGQGYTTAYLTATLRYMNMEEQLSTDASLLAAIVGNKKALGVWETEYRRFRDKLSEENIPFELGMIVRLVCDGLMFANLFRLDLPDRREQERIARYLLQLLEGDKT